MNFESADNILHSYISDDPVGDDSDSDNDDIIEQIESAEIETEIQGDEFFDTTYESNEQQSSIVVEKKKTGKAKKAQSVGTTVAEIKSQSPTTRSVVKMRSKTIKEDREAGKIHICEICGNSYKYRHALEVHMRRHRGDR